MLIEPPFIRGQLMRRYKRFLADVEFPGGLVETVHCPNTGAMTGCDIPGSEAWCSRSDNGKRKYPLTLEVVVVDDHPIVVNTGRANGLVAEAVRLRQIEAFQDYGSVRAEVKSPDGRGRFDLLLRGDGVPDCFVEVKSVTYLISDGLGVFPDARSERARKHLESLMSVVASGARAVLFFCVQHAGIQRVAPAEKIDPGYASLLREAMAAGVEVYAWRSAIARESLRLAEPVPFTPTA